MTELAESTNIYASINICRNICQRKNICVYCHSEHLKKF